MKCFLVLLLFPLSLMGQVGVTSKNLNTNDFRLNTNVAPYDIRIQTNRFPPFSAFPTNYFLTNGYLLQLNTNYGSAYSNSVVNIINQNPSPSGGDFWKTNTVEGGIWYTNSNDPNAIAKFAAQSPGTFVSGWTNATGKVIANGNGAVALGYATAANSKVFANAEAAFALGRVQNGGTITSAGQGTVAMGAADEAGTITTGFIDRGVMVGGFAKYAATIKIGAGCNGSIAWGEAEDTNSVIWADAWGDLALGVAFGGGTIKVTAYGAVAQGVTDTDDADGVAGTILSDGDGSVASGFSGTGALIAAYSDGSRASGGAHYGGQLKAISDSSFVNGNAESNGVIQASGTIIIQSVGNTALGYANGTGSSILSEGKGAMCGGIATNGWRHSAIGAASFTWGQNVGSESADFSFSYGNGFTNTTDRSANFGWFPTRSYILRTNLIQEATDTGGQMSPRRVVAKPVTLTTNSATAVATITLPTSLSTLGAKVYATTKIKNATDWAYVTEEFTWGAGNKAGTVTTKVSAAAQTCSDGTGGATVTTTWTATVSGTTITLKNTAVTAGIAATTTTCLWRIETDSDDAIVITPQ